MLNWYWVKKQSYGFNPLHGLKQPIGWIAAAVVIGPGMMGGRLPAYGIEPVPSDAALPTTGQAIPVVPPPPSPLPSESAPEGAPIAPGAEGTVEHDPDTSQERDELRVSPPVNTIDAATVSINDYVLGTGDRLQIDVFESPEYSGEYEVLPDGTLRMPFINAISVRGLTIEDTSSLISRQYAAILRRPLVSVRLLETRPLLLAVTGEVNRPGSYQVSLTESEGVPTVTQAIQQAGGITQLADIRSIQVQRRGLDGQDPPAVITVDLWKLLREADLRQDIALQDGDRIIVPEAPVIELDEATEVASATFSPEQMPVNVVGEVGNPGTIQVPPNTPLNQAILAAGGFTNRSRRGRVDLVQLNPNGTVTKREIEVDLSVNANGENNPLLRPYDTVIVNRSTFTRVTDVLARALSPVTAVFSLLNLLGL